MPKIKQKITTYLWYNNQAQDAATFYCSLFKNSRILSANPMIVTFELDGQRFIALNGGPKYKFTEAISLYVDCENQQEVDELWKKLTVNGGAESMCGWLKDRFGLSWQIIPTTLIELMSDKDQVKAQRVIDAMLKMSKIEVKKLREAYNNY